MPSVPGYYPVFELKAAPELPSRLREILRRAWDHRYRELYEDEPGGTRLEESLGEVLDALWAEGGEVGHRRHLWVALALGCAAVPTVEAHLPGLAAPRRALEIVRHRLAGNTVDPSDMAEELFPHRVVGAQAANESLDVFRNLLLAMDPSRSRQALLEMLEDVLEGYAIIPGSAGRRDLLNWFLVEVVPAAWHERLPKAIYTMRWPWPPEVPSHGSPADPSTLGRPCV